MAILGAFFIKSPGYMDADYYFATGRELAAGAGFTEPFIWTYITDPPAVPAPSHLYWMPLTSLVAGASMKLLGASFRAGQLPFLLLFAFLPLAVSKLSLRVHGDPEDAFRSGLLAAFPGFFLPYFLTTDMFIIYAWIGLGVTTLIIRKDRMKAWNPIGLGILVGLAHLARADGWLLAFPALAGILHHEEDRPRNSLLLISGYALVMGPWFARNMSVIGSPLPPGTTRSLWFTAYSDLFRYPSDSITIKTWLKAGWGAALRVRAEALAINMERLIAENGLIFMAPFMLIGGIKLRHKLEVKAGYLYGLLLFFLMTVVFPFAGTHGGMFHSTAALMPLLWCLAPIGLDTAINYAAVHRKWELGRARALFQNTALAFAFLLTLGLAVGRVVGQDPRNPRWNHPEADYRALSRVISNYGQNTLTVVNNPPGFFLATGSPAVVLPDGGLDALQAVVERYKAGWVVVDENTTAGLWPLYHGTHVPEWLSLHAEMEDSNAKPIVVYRVNEDGIR
jgi:hypothetical protein